MEILSSGIRRTAALALATACASAGAQQFPARSIELYVAFGPGGAGDVVARIVAKKVAENIGQAVVIDNKPAPMVAPVAVAKAKPDGYTLLMAGSGTALTDSLFKRLPYNLMGDFKHVSTMASFDFAFITDASSPFKTVADVVAYAKANPGALNIATSRLGSTLHLAAEMFKSATGIEAVIVPYKTTGEIIAALRSKAVQVGFEILPGVNAQIEQKLLRPIAVTSRQRFPGLPEVPTIAESGYPGYEASSWNGISVPAATPAPVIERLSREFNAAVASPEVQKELIALGVRPEASTPEQMTARMQQDIDKWRATLAKVGIEPQ